MMTKMFMFPKALLLDGYYLQDKLYAMDLKWDGEKQVVIIPKDLWPFSRYLTILEPNLGSHLKPDIYVTLSQS